MINIICDPLEMFKYATDGMEVLAANEKPLPPAVCTAIIFFAKHRHVFIIFIDRHYIVIMDSQSIASQIPGDSICSHFFN